MPEDKMPEDKMHDNPYPNPYAWPHPTVTGPLPSLPLYTHPLSISLSLYIKTPFVSIYTDTLYLSTHCLAGSLHTLSLSVLFSTHTNSLSLSLSFSLNKPLLSLFLSLSKHTLFLYVYLHSRYLSTRSLYNLFSLHSHAHTRTHSLSLFLTKHVLSISLNTDTLYLSTDTLSLFISFSHSLYLCFSLNTH